MSRRLLKVPRFARPWRVKDGTQTTPMIQGSMVTECFPKLAVLSQFFLHFSSVTVEDEVSQHLSMHST